MAKEQEIQKRIIKYLESIDAYVIKVISASRNGVPDIIFCYEGVFGAIEVKTPDTRNNVSKLQEFNIDSIVNAGGRAIVAWEVAQVEDFIAGILS